MTKMWWAFLLGYIFSVGGSLFLVRLVVDTMWKQLGWKGHPTTDDVRPFAWHARIIGCLDVVLYTSSWLVEKPQFIAVWLALKVAPRWGRWEKEGKKQGRPVYNVFLMGNGLAISYGVVGGKITQWVIREMWTEAIAVPAVVVLFTLGLWIWARHHATGYEKVKNGGPETEHDIT